MLKKLFVLYLKIKSLIFKNTYYWLVDTSNNRIIKFQNGSTIETINNVNPSDIIRGKRAKFYDWSDLNNYYTTEELSEILKSFYSK